MPTLGRANGGVAGWVEGSLVVLDVPVRSQFDGSEYQASNCGPASLAMVLEAFGVQERADRLRNLANHLQGTYDRENGIALDVLGHIAVRAGLQPIDLYDGGSYRRWSLEAIRREVRRGHPVITLVRMDRLPYQTTAATTEHYIVIVGLDGESLLVNDSAMPANQGFRRTLTPGDLERAWDASSIPRQAIAFGAGDGVAELNLPDPPTMTPTASPTGSPTPSPSATATAVPPIIVIVHAPPLDTPTAVPTATPLRERWARPDVPTPRPDDGRWRRADSPRDEPTLVLSQARPGVPLDVPYHWLVRGAIVLASALALRWTVREDEEYLEPRSSG